jgi:hypothetical protein
MTTAVFTETENLKQNRYGSSRIASYFEDNFRTRCPKRGRGYTKIICRNKVYTVYNHTWLLKSLLLQDIFTYILETHWNMCKHVWKQKCQSSLQYFFSVFVAFIRSFPSESILREFMNSVQDSVLFNLTRNSAFTKLTAILFLFLLHTLFAVNWPVTLFSNSGTYESQVWPIRDSWEVVQFRDCPDQSGTVGKPRVIPESRSETSGEYEDECRLGCCAV